MGWHGMICVEASGHLADFGWSLSIRCIYICQKRLDLLVILGFQTFCISKNLRGPMFWKKWLLNFLTAFTWPFHVDDAPGSTATLWIFRYISWSRSLNLEHSVTDKPRFPCYGHGQRIESRNFDLWVFEAANEFSVKRNMGGLGFLKGARATKNVKRVRV